MADGRWPRLAYSGVQSASDCLPYTSTFRSSSLGHSEVDISRWEDKICLSNSLLS